MSTLLLRLVAPMQSWGVDSIFDRRSTGRTPSKSGVIGLCAAALGFRRSEDEKLSKLAKLSFGVRIDRAGTLLKDFHMAHEDEFWDPNDRSKINRGKKTSSYLTTRYYLSDAAFLAGLEGNAEFLGEIDAAIRAPMFPLYLGRRSCPPEGRVSLGIVAGSLQEALENCPSITNTRQTYYYAENDKQRIVMDAERITGPDKKKNYYSLRDVPQSYNPEHRKYDFRSVCEFDKTVPLITKEHDAMAAVEEDRP